MGHYDEFLERDAPTKKDILLISLKETLSELEKKTRDLKLVISILEKDIQTKNWPN